MRAHHAGPQTRGPAARCRYPARGVPRSRAPRRSVDRSRSGRSSRSTARPTPTSAGSHPARRGPGIPRPGRLRPGRLCSAPRPGIGYRRPCRAHDPGTNSECDRQGPNPADVETRVCHDLLGATSRVRGPSGRLLIRKIVRAHNRTSDAEAPPICESTSPPGKARTKTNACLGDLSQSGGIFGHIPETRV